MQVQIIPMGVQGVPLSMLTETQARKAKRKVADMAYMYVYFCSALNGVEKIVFDEENIPADIYELPDEEWKDEE